MKLSKNWVTVMPLSRVIALILFISLPFIGFYIGYEFPHNLNQYHTNKELVQKPSSEILVLDTTDWKTYKSRKYGYSFKYPANFFVEETFNPNNNGQDSVSISNYSFADFPNGKVNPDDNNVFLMNINNPLEGTTDLEKLRGNYDNNHFFVNNYTIDGIQGFKVRGKNVKDYEGELIEVILKNKEYQFSLRSVSSIAESDFEKILSTFKFFGV